MSDELAADVIDEVLRQLSGGGGSPTISDILIAAHARAPHADSEALQVALWSRFLITWRPGGSDLAATSLPFVTPLVAPLRREP